MYRVPLRNLAVRISRHDKKTIRSGRALNVPQDDFWGDSDRKATRTFSHPPTTVLRVISHTMYGYLSNSRDRDFAVLRERRMRTEVRSERNFNRLETVFSSSIMPYIVVLSRKIAEICSIEIGIFFLSRVK